MHDVLTFGEALAVFVPASGETVERSVGGTEFNLAVALATLGRDVTYVTRVGDDPFGQAIEERARRAGVRAHIEVDPSRPTGIYFREPATASGRRVYYYRRGSAASALGPDDIAPLHEFRVVHTTGITAMLSDTCYAAVVEASRAGTFTLDVNFRPALADADAWRQRVEPLLSSTAIAFISTEDEQVVSRDRALELGASAVVQTRGAGGASFVDRDGRRFDVPAREVEVVDTVGAGDAFVAGFLDVWLDAEDPEAALVAGCELGARVVSVPHDQLAL